MKRTLLLLLVLASVCAVRAQRIDISTDKTDLILNVADNGRLYQSYLGETLADKAEAANVAAQAVDNRWEVYPGSGGEDYYEPALAATHADGNLTTILKYVSHKQMPTAYGSETEITLRDELYPVEVKLYYQAYSKENVVKTWSVIINNGKKPIDIWRYASALLYFDRAAYYLTEFSSEWAREVRMATQQLQFGKKIVDSKLGSRAAMHAQPFFELGLSQPASESEGEVLMGTLGWTGNFQFTFEVDHLGNLRVIPAINAVSTTGHATISSKMAKAIA